MRTTMTIPTSQSTFQTKSLPPSPLKSGGAMSFGSVPGHRSSHGAVSMTCARASGQSPHTVLGVAHGATKAEIKAAYRRLALQFHPDVCKGDRCSARFQQIHWAYEALMSMAAPPSAESEDGSSDDVEGLMGLDEELWQEWMGWEGAGTLDFSNPIDNAN